MEHQKSSRKSVSKILNFLPRATSSVHFQSPSLYSPVNNKKPSEKTHKSNLGNGFSGPIISIIPAETRRKIKNHPSSTPLHEPISPTVSCMGQVKCKHYRKLDGVNAGAGNLANKPIKKYSRTTSYNPVRSDQEKVMKVDQVVEKSKKKLGFRSLLRGGGGCRKKSEVDHATDDVSKKALTIPKSQSLSTMKRFASGRDAFMNFDWTTQVAPVDSGRRNYFTDSEKDGGESDGEEVMTRNNNKGVCDEFVRVGGVKLEPRKEVNLWKRRTMAQPQALQVHAAN